MNMNIYNMRKELHSYAINVQNEYYANRNVNKYRIKYLIVVKIFENIMSLNDEKSIKDYLNMLLENSNKCKKIYDDLYSKFNKETNNEEKTKILKELNEYVARLNAYNESYNIISKYFKVSLVIPKQEVSKKEEQPKKETLTNDDTSISNTIIGLLEKYNDLDKNTTEAKRVLEQIYNLRLEREKKFKNLYGLNYRAYVSSLESIENMAAMTPNEGFKPNYLEIASYVLELRNTINAINEFYFIDELQIKKFYKKNNSISDGNNENKYFKKFNNYIRKFHVLISSLFTGRSINFEVDGETISTDDFLSYLSTCNLDGDFSVYKKKFVGSKIGTLNADKKRYNESLMFLNKCINALCEIARKEAGDKKIIVVDKEVVKSDLIKERDKQLKDIYVMSQIQANNRGMGYERK